MQEPLFTTVKLEDFDLADHPLRPVRLLVNDASKRLNGLFNVIYADTDRASIAPEKLLRPLLLQVFYSVRSERMLMEQMRYTCCSAGSSDWRSRTTRGTTRCSRRNATGCWSMKSWKRSY
ncbi:hypothetical protein B0G69_7774 [Paraburkholderia sp. RAU2J]|nr:hypothetical protein B0G69_7774 [Paraburkholderia sp. RAU2J]